MTRAARRADAFVADFLWPTETGLRRRRTAVVRLGARRWHIPLGRLRPKCQECDRMGRNCSLHVGEARE